ncbi:hypothetical protein JL721_8334 [Aureococcus anophagefferens]|nr:hypothetical protein JL721_8334 [Aureococcus anophagefferens]
MPRTYTHYASALLFFYFGLRMLKDASSMSGSGVSEELGEVEEELGGAGHGKKDVEDDGAEAPPPTEETDAVKVLGQAFMLTFLAEWGDRSQIATIALPPRTPTASRRAASSATHVHGLAVVGGRMLASRISERPRRRRPHLPRLRGLAFFFEDVHDEASGASCARPRAADGVEVAIKKVRCAAGSAEGVNFQVLREIKMLRDARHPHVVRLFDVFRNPGGDATLSLVFELLATDLEKVLYDGGGALVADGVAKGYGFMLLTRRFLHAHHVLHRDASRRTCSSRRRAC